MTSAFTDRNKDDLAHFRVVLTLRLRLIAATKIYSCDLCVFSRRPQACLVRSNLRKDTSSCVQIVQGIGSYSRLVAMSIATSDGDSFPVDAHVCVAQDKGKKFKVGLRFVRHLD